MTLVPLDIPPGFYANGTDLQGSGRWIDGNLVRWRDKALRPVGGWVTTYAGSFDGTTRTLATWQLSNGTVLLVGGSTTKLYTAEPGNAPSVTATSVGVGRPHLWSIAPFGFELLFAYWNGTLNVATTPTTTAAVSGAPAFIHAMVVTAERFVMTGERQTVTWSDREDYTVWTAAATNEAGDFTLQTAGKIQQFVNVRGQTLVLTDEDAHAATYVGPPFVYGFERVGDKCGPISKQSAVAIDGAAIWMGRSGFHYYEAGRVNDVPCDVLDHVFGNMSAETEQTALGVVPYATDYIVGVHNPAHNEVWWLYPSTGQTDLDSYVAFNYVTKAWHFGAMDRQAAQAIGSDLYMVNKAGDLFQHEVGFLYDGAVPYAETGPFNIGAGDNLMTAVSLIPDEVSQGDVTATFKVRNYPNAAETTFGPYTLDAPTDVRFTGRQVRQRITGSVATDWRVGINRLDVRPRGTR